MEGRWISSEELSKRWKCAPFELVNAMLSGGLVAIDIQTGARFTAYSVGALCFFCEKDLNGERPNCFYLSDIQGKERFKNENPIICGEFPLLQSGKFSNNRDRALYRVDISKEKTFLLAEVEAYEQAHGLGPLPHKPESAEALAETLRAAGITDASMRAKMINAAFELPLRELGAIMTGKPDDDGNSAANIKTAQRLLGKSK